MERKLEQKKIAKIGMVFMSIILVLTFFSKTFMNITLPKVRVGKAMQMNLNNTFECKANAMFQKEVPIYAPFQGKVLKAYVKVGDEVKKGDILYQLDIEEIKKELQTKQIELKKVEVNLKLQGNKVNSIHEKLNRIEQEINEEQGEQSLVEDKTLEIKEAQALVTVNEDLYRNELISESELRKSQIALESLVNAQQKELKENEKAKKGTIKTLKEEIISLKDEEKELQGQVELQQLEIEQIKLEIADLENIKNEKGMIIASSEGKVLEAKEGEIAVEGQRISENQLLLRLGSLTAGYRLEVEIQPEIDFMKIDDLVDLKSEDVADLKGRINQMTKEKDHLKIGITFSSEVVSVGDEMTIIFKEGNKIYDNVIPYSAVYKEEDSYFVFVAEEIDDALGKSYIVKKKKVYMVDYNDTYAAISEGITVLDKVIITSEDEISEGMRIRLENENEVLENE